VTWIGAAAYAAWAGARLPTFAELNTATLASSPTNTFYAVGDTVAVTEPGRGPGEAHHLVGNVQVWCDDGPATELLHCLSAVPIDTSSQGHGRYGHRRLTCLAAHLDHRDVKDAEGRFIVQAEAS
jgi:hypothetical protein